MTTNDGLVTVVDAAVAEYGHDRSALLAVLKYVREHHHDLSDQALRLVGAKLSIPVTSVQAVATFYSFLQTGTTGQHTVRVCRTLACQMAGSDDLATTISDQLGTPMGTTRSDGTVTLEWTNCLGQCDHAPAVLFDDQPLLTSHDLEINLSSVE